MPQFIQPSDLKPGDVFLYHGDSFLSRLIRLFDGTEYSHASIFSGDDHVVEALGEGVVGRSIKQSIADAKFTDVYRYRNKDSGGQLGDDQSPLPAKPVIAKATAFEQNKDRYAYEQIVFLALLASTRQTSAPSPLLGMILRNLLDHASDVLAHLIATGKEPLICSELVYRCYIESGAAYQVRIRGADLARAVARASMAAPVELAAPVGTVQPSSDAAAFQEAAAGFLENYQAAKAVSTEGKPQVFAAAPGDNAALAAVANFVTPGDLKKSPDLQLLGTLRE
jgi:hypothetical protein